MFLRVREREMDVLEAPVLPPSSQSPSQQHVHRVKVARLAWKDSWYNDFIQIQFISYLGNCKEKKVKDIFANRKSISIKC